METFVKLFKLEGQILNVWSTSNDLDLLLESYLDGPSPMTEDAVANMLIGIKVLHDARCSKLFDMYERLLNSASVGDLR